MQRVVRFWKHDDGYYWGAGYPGGVLGPFGDYLLVQQVAHELRAQGVRVVVEAPDMDFTNEFPGTGTV